MNKVHLWITILLISGQTGEDQIDYLNIAYTIMNQNLDPILHLFILQTSHVETLKEQGK